MQVDDCTYASKQRDFLFARGARKLVAIILLWCPVPFSQALPDLESDPFASVKRPLEARNAYCMLTCRVTRVVQVEQLCAE
eukprot:3029-Amphidinium_carterae.1